MTKKELFSNTSTFKEGDGTSRKVRIIESKIARDEKLYEEYIKKNSLKKSVKDQTIWICQ